MRIVIVSGGTPPSKERLLEYLKEDDFIIGADSGCNILKTYNILPNLMLGDFDSANLESVEYFKNKGVECLKYPPEKNYTDTHLAYEIGKERGGKEFLIFGATGTRMDHTLGNVGLMLIALKEGNNITIIDDNNLMYAKDKNFKVQGDLMEVISFHALSDKVEGLTIKGGKYTLEDYNLQLLEPRTICNEFLEEDIEITFKSGKILVIYSRD